MTNQELITFLRGKFKEQDETISNLRKAISSLTFTTLILHEMIKDKCSKEEKDKAIEAATIQMGKLKALIDSKRTDLNKIWESHFKL